MNIIKQIAIKGLLNEYNQGLNPNCQLIIATHSPSIFGNGREDKLFFVEDLIQ
jgi:predicted ATPase